MTETNNRVSFIQGVISAMDESASHKRRAIDLLAQLSGWLSNSLDRDLGFRERMVKAITDNTDPIDDGMKRIAESFRPANDNQESK